MVSITGCGFLITCPLLLRLLRTGTISHFPVQAPALPSIPGTKEALNQCHPVSEDNHCITQDEPVSPFQLLTPR